MLSNQEDTHTLTFSSHCIEGIRKPFETKKQNENEDTNFSIGRKFDLIAAIKSAFLALRVDKTKRPRIC